MDVYKSYNYLDIDYHLELQQLGYPSTMSSICIATPDATCLELPPDEADCQSPALPTVLTYDSVREPYLNNVDWYNFTSEDFLTLFRLADFYHLQSPVDPTQQTTHQDTPNISLDNAKKTPVKGIILNQEPATTSYTQHLDPPIMDNGAHTVHSNHQVDEDQNCGHVFEEGSDCLSTSAGALSAVISAPQVSPLERSHHVLVDTQPSTASINAAQSPQSAISDGHLTTGKTVSSNSSTPPFKSPQSSIASDAACHTRERTFICTLCEKMSSSNVHLVQHRRTHTRDKTFACAHCKTTFSRKFDLVRHGRTHTGEKPFACAHCTCCKTTFSRKSHLVYRERTHTGDKPFACSHCKKTFRQKSHLVDHGRTHTGDKPFACSHCKKTFSRKSDLVRHGHMHKRHAMRLCLL